MFEYLTNKQLEPVLLMCSSILKEEIGDDLIIDFSVDGCKITHETDTYSVNDRQARALFDLTHKKLKQLDPRFNDLGLKKLTLTFNVFSLVSVDQVRDEVNQVRDEVNQVRDEVKQERST